MASESGKGPIETTAYYVCYDRPEDRRTASDGFVSTGPVTGATLACHVV